MLSRSPVRGRGRETGTALFRTAFGTFMTGRHGSVPFGSGGTAKVEGAGERHRFPVGSGAITGEVEHSGPLERNGQGDDPAIPRRRSHRPSGADR